VAAGSRLALPPRRPTRRFWPSVAGRTASAARPRTRTR